MTEVSFYHLEPVPLEQALPRLLERVLDAGYRAVIRVEVPERADQLDKALWTYRPDSFLPHGTARDANSADQPICITHEADNPNSANVLVLVDGVEATDADRFERCLDLFNGNDEKALEAARDRWRRAREAGFEVTYWRHETDGAWQKQE